GVSAAFILVNSAAGLAGHWYVVREVPLAAAPWGVAAVLGGFLGAELGSRRLGGFALRRLLAVVLVIAGVKMMLL
ncbi:MAG: sulfite exporter TauE/SafE family protein, partial [Phycisphaerae bacterium]|nr:sulfite exporter TauE/SafE family protein [Phycisphaerae bacterium]